MNFQFSDRKATFKFFSFLSFIEMKYLSLIIRDLMSLKDKVKCLLANELLVIYTEQSVSAAALTSLFVYLQVKHNKSLSTTFKVTIVHNFSVIYEPLTRKEFQAFGATIIYFPHCNLPLRSLFPIYTLFLSKPHESSQK